MRKWGFSDNLALNINTFFCVLPWEWGGGGIGVESKDEGDYGDMKTRHTTKTFSILGGSSRFPGTSVAR